MAFNGARDPRDSVRLVAGVDADASTRPRVRPPDALEIPSCVARPLPPR